MRLRHLAQAALPVLVVSGCLLPSFDNVAAPAAGGGAGLGGSGGDAGEAAAAGEGGEAGTATPASATLVDDVYSVLQGSTLSVPAPGVLENDSGTTLVVTATDDSDAARPKSYDATKLSIAEDGALEFEPQPDFFGSYSLQYTVKDGTGQSTTATVTIHVQPVSAKLAAVRDGIGGFVIDGAAKDAIGAAISSAGDVNHDGFDDLLIGAPTSAVGAGRAYVVYGRARTSTVALQALPAKSSERTFFDFEGVAGDGLGNAVAGIGDLNGDGFSDFAVAATGAAPAGAVYVLFGGALSGGYALGALTSARGARLTGGTAPIGELIGGAGDVNGDGTPDLLVSGASNNGHVYAVLGSDRLKDSPIDSLTGLFQIEGGSINEGLPSSLDTVGKLAGDDKDAVVLASQGGVVVVRGSSAAYPADSSKATVEGAAGFYYPLLNPTKPQVAVAGAGNVDADAAHVDDVMICELLAGVGQCRVLLNSSATNPWLISGFSGLPHLGHGADLNGDGLSDLLFGDATTAYAVFGKKGAHPALDVTSLGDAGFSLEAEASTQIDAVATLGDVNGDGIADYAVGSSAAHGGTGTVYVIFGEN